MPPRQDGWRCASWRLVIHEALPSTSDLCRNLAAAGAPERLAVLAQLQTRGRGSRGRDWTSPPGNYYGSVLLRPPIPAREAGQWSLLAGVAVATALSALTPPGAVKLKWPNDVLLHQAKLAGILVDSAARADGMLDWLVIGVGVNLAVAPAIPGRAVAALSDIAAPPTPEQFAHSFLAALDRWQQTLWQHGFAAVRAAWLAQSPAIGAPMSLRIAEQILTGHFAGLGDDGSLLLDCDGARRRFGAGEVLL